MAKKLKITLLKSMHGRRKGHKECLIGLGLKRIRHCVQVEDTPCTRGMVNKVSYLLNVEEA